MHVEAFVPAMDQFENLGLIELRRLREEPPLHCLFELVFRIFLPRNFFMSPNRWKSEDARSRLYGGCFKTSQPYPSNFSRNGRDTCGRALQCISKLPISPNGPLQLSSLFQKETLSQLVVSLQLMLYSLTPSYDELYRYVESQDLALRPVSSTLQLPFWEIIPVFPNYFHT